MASPTTVRIGERGHRIALSRPTDSTHDAYRPDQVWAQIVSSEASQEDERRRTLRLRIPYHAQLTLDTIITFKGRQFQVLGLSNVNEANIIHELFCHEVLTP